MDCVFIICKLRSEIRFSELRLYLLRATDTSETGNSNGCPIHGWQAKGPGVYLKYNRLSHRERNRKYVKIATVGKQTGWKSWKNKDWNF